MFPVISAVTFAASFTLWLLAVRSCKIASGDRKLAEQFARRDEAVLASIQNQRRELNGEQERYNIGRQQAAYEEIARQNREESLAEARARGREEGIELCRQSHKARKLPIRIRAN